MELGLVGLGRMGSSMTLRLLRRGHELVVFDLDADRRRATAAEGARAVESLEALVEALEPRRAVWIMVPHGPATKESVDRLVELMDEGDVIVDGGNSRYTDSTAAAERAKRSGVDLLDVGVSGGVWGLEDGYCLMVGGDAAAYAHLEPAFEALAPTDGYARVGASGAGHFVKMIHNAVEYGMLQALGEGFECLARSDFELDLSRVGALWQHGSVVRSWLLELLVRAFEAEGDDLRDVAPWVDDSGMGRWSVEYALERAIPVPAIATALLERFDSRIRDRFSAKVIAALRKQFGGHAVREEAGV
jgi:6-phosphogluconate dehydrogenase